MQIGRGKSAEASRFGQLLRSWRRHNNVKQAALAYSLGVSQPAVARWESGVDTPSPGHLRQIRDMMARASRDEVAIQAMFVARQSAIAALYDFEEMRMVANSGGFQRIWPDFATLLDMPMRDHLVDEAGFIANDGDMRHAIMTGSLCLISGVSTRQTDVRMDEAFRHRWHICFRNLGGRVFVDMVYEPCEPDAVLGIGDMVYLDGSAGSM